MGYSRAGFEVVGVDIEPQPHYPFEFYQGDALTYPLDGFAAYHASPPCKADNQAVLCRVDRELLRAKYPRLIGPIRERLAAMGKAFVIENVPMAKRQLINPVMLCGTMFGLKVKRHRYFELHGFEIPFAPAACGCKGRAGFTNSDRGLSSFARGARLISIAGHNFSVGDARTAMGIEWMTAAELSQAIPPAYTEYIGKYLMQEVMEEG